MKVHESSPDGPTKAANRTTRRRWVDIVMMGLIAGAIVILAIDFIMIGLVWLTKMDAWTLWPCSIGVLWLLRRQRARLWAFLGIKRFFHYPPVWLAAVLGSLCTMMFWAAVPSAAKSIGMSAWMVAEMFGWGSFIWKSLLAIVVTVFGIFLALGALFLAREQAAHTPGSGKRGESTKHADNFTFEALTAWLMDDAPVDHPDRDQFGHHRIARRIARRLVTAKTPDEASIALLGRLGSGKTSVCELVKHEVAKQAPRGDVKIVQVSVWPFETREAAMRRLLAALVDSLKEEVNVVGLRSLPDQYIRVIEGFAGRWSPLVSLWTTTEPQDVLQRIDDIASAIGIRMVLWVEDLERFAADDRAAHTTALGSVRALLHQLDELSAISVVIASTDLSARFDLEKIARFVEPIPDIDSATCSRLLDCFRTGCMEELGEYSDLVAPENRKKLDLSNWELYQQFPEFVRRSPQAPIPIGFALPQLCRNPRQLKQALRACLDTWKSLLGEIDFGDLLAMSLLKQAYPSVFALVAQYVDALRNADPGSRETSPRAGFNAHLDDLRLQETERSVVNSVVSFVFPELAGSRSRHQGFAVKYPRDYWQRFLAMPELREEERDLPILAAVKERRIADLATWLMDPAREEPTMAFCRDLNFEEKLQLFDCVITGYAEQSPLSWGQLVPPGIIAIWQLLPGRGSDPAALFELLERKLEETMPLNLHLAVGLTDWFTRQETQQRLNFEQQALELRERLHELFRQHYVNQPDKLAAALENVREGQEHILAWAFYGVEKIRENDYGDLPMEQWDDVRTTLLEAAEQMPKAVLPQIASLIVDGRPPYSMNEERAERLFGRDVIVDLFTKYADLEINSELYEAVRSAAVAARTDPASHQG